MLKFIKTRKRLASLATVVVLGAAAFGAYAYFTSGGSGSGTAKVGTAEAVTIRQIGAGYDSLVSSNIYHQDQTFQAAGITKFGNDITLANSGAQQLVSVVVAFRNWGGAISGLPIKFSIPNSTSGPISATTDASFAAVDPITGRPSVTNVTFDFSGLGAKVPQEFVYSIEFDSSGDAGGLNVALSSSANDLSVGSDTTPGTVWLEVDNPAYASLGNDFPPCTTTPPIDIGTFEQVVTNCGASNGNNAGAYGDNINTGSTDADIPAVEVNVVGGELSSLTPNGPSLPIEFAITNPGSASVFISTVTSSVSSISGAGSVGGSEDCTPDLFPFSPLDGVTAINTDVPTGTTLFQSTGTSISMPDDHNNQDDCEGATVNLGFTSP